MAGYDVDLERARAERDFRQNPPSSAPGQGDMGSTDWDDIFSNAGDGSTSNESALTGLDSGVAGGGLDSILNPQPTQQTQQIQPQGGSLESAIEKGITVGGKYAVTLTKDVASSTKTMSFNNWVVTFRNYALVGAGLTGLGILLWVFALFAGGEAYKATSITVGGLLSLLIGGSLWWFLLPIAKRRQAEEEASPKTEVDLGVQEDFPDFNSDFDSYDETPDQDFGDDLYQDVEDDEMPDDDLWGDFDEDFGDEEEVISGPTEENLDIEKELDSVPEIDRGTQTRSYLVEVFSKVLPLYQPNFTQMKEISDTSDLFISFEQWLRDAAAQTGVKEENLPELTKLRENAFIYQLLATRPTGLKEQEIADLIADTFSRDETGRVVKKGIYATVDSSIGVLRINLFRSERVMISLGDVYRNQKEWVTDPSVRMPMVWGIDELGTPVCCDAYDMFTLIISGVPRGGKSWKGQSFLLQLCMFNSPKEINFYFFDPKGDQSDYEYFSRVFPHAKGFVSDVHKIPSSLQRMIDKEVKHRRKILKQHGAISIKDFKRDNPDIYLPYIYVVMDELATMVKEFTKEEKAEFDTLVSIMCSQLPNLGFRLIMFPHRIVNNIINKDVYELVSCRCIVKSQNFSEIQNAIGVSRKEFPNNLVNEGDMGIRTPDINKGVPSFCHSEIITSKNETNKEVFKFVAEVWKRLEPDYSQGIYDSLLQSTNITEKATGGWLENHINEVCGINTGSGSLKSNQGGTSVPHQVRDNSIGDDYQYQGFNSQGETGVADLADSVPDSEDDSDEDFWDDFL